MADVMIVFRCKGSCFTLSFPPFGPRITRLFLDQRDYSFIVRGFPAFSALRSFCLDAKRTKKIKANPIAPRVLPAHAQHPSAALISVYDRPFVYGGVFPNFIAESKCGGNAAGVRNGRRCIFRPGR